MARHLVSNVNIMRNRNHSSFLSLSMLCFLLFVFVATADAQSTYGRRPALMQVDALRKEYFALEQSLWDYLRRTADSQNNRESQIKKIYDSHRQFIYGPLMSRKFNYELYNIMNHYEWKLLDSKINHLNSIFDFYKDTFMKQVSSRDLEERALLDLTEQVLRNDKTFSMSQIFQEIEYMMVNQAMYYRGLVMARDEMCKTRQSPQQFIYSLYTDISLTELKGYTMMEFSWMMLRVYGKGNFSQESELMRRDYEKRMERTVNVLRNVMNYAERMVWRCDPQKEHVLNKTYDEVTRLMQGFIVNEVDLNTDDTCRETCPYYQSTKVETCFKELYCARQPKCSGRLYNCQYVDSDMTVCPAALSSNRRYEYIEYENGRFLGERKKCVRGTSRVESWWRWIFWHCSYCFCLCDEQSMKSDRFFNLRESVSDIKANKVVTGLRFVKRNRVFHLQIQEGQLVPRGGINESSLEWKPVNNYKIFDRNVAKGEDYHTLSYESRSIDLDDMQSHDNSQVVTGVRFRVLGAHLNLEARLSIYDFKKGELVQPEVNSIWQSNDNTDVSGERRKKLELKDLDIPSRTLARSLPISEHNQYIDFSVSGMDQDASQSTIPFIDIQDVTSNPPVPLAGIGIYYKASPGYGGFLAPKIITYNFTPHVRKP